VARPLNIGWSLGTYCQGKCQHCYSWRSRTGRAALSKEELDTISDKLVAAGVRTVNIGGNEPLFTHGPDHHVSLLPHLVERLAGDGVAVGITTNGTTAQLMESDFRDAFLKVNDWDVSLDSPFKEEHDKNRGVPLYDIALDALRLCTAYRRPKAIVLCGMNWNLDNYHLQGFLDLARDHDAELRINSLKPTRPEHQRLLPTREQYFSAFAYLLPRTDPIVIAESALAAITPYAAPGCSCGISSLRILPKTPEGTVPVSPCVYLDDFKVGDLLREELSDIVNSEKFQQLRRRNEKLPADCRDCDIGELCRGGCAARAHLITGTLAHKDPYCGREDRSLVRIATGAPSHEGVRVHEGYLCTWIGKPR
jgi:radical SAM protein with 4Fe4S-binding SPASM domain